MLFENTAKIRVRVNAGNCQRRYCIKPMAGPRKKIKCQIKRLKAGWELTLGIRSQTKVYTDVQNMYYILQYVILKALPRTHRSYFNK